MPSTRRFMLACALQATLVLAATPAVAQDKGSTFRLVPSSDLKVLDPTWTTAVVTRNHGYMIYDTLFGTDAQGRIQPQMVESHTVSSDGKTWVFKLRPGLAFHDGKPVTAEDVLAS